METEDKIPFHYIKYLRDEIYELRVTFGHNEFRIMFIYDGNDIVECIPEEDTEDP